VPRKSIGKVDRLSRQPDWQEGEVEKDKKGVGKTRVLLEIGIHASLHDTCDSLCFTFLLF